jgi:DNA modification methylase
MKPVGLLRNLILNSSRIDEWVYDPFLGSGSTLIASEQTRRRCVGIELDPEYCQVIIDRYKKVTGKEALKL